MNRLAEVHRAGAALSNQVLSRLCWYYTLTSPAVRPLFVAGTPPHIYTAFFQVLPTGVSGSPPHWRTRSRGLTSLLRLVGLAPRSLILSASGAFSPSKTPATQVSCLKRPRYRWDSCLPPPCTSLWAAPGQRDQLSALQSGNPSCLVASQPTVAVPQGLAPHR